MGKGPGKALITSFSIIVLLMIAIICTSIRGLDMIQNETNRIINHVIPINESSSNILIALINEETGMRGYLLSQNEDFLKPYYTGNRQIKKELTIIDANIEKYPELKEIVHTAKYDINSIQNYFKNEISLVKSGKLKEAHSNLSNGNRLVDEFREEHNEIDRIINDYTNRTIHNSALQKAKVVNILIIACFIVFLMMLAIIAMILQIISDDINNKQELNKSLEMEIKGQEEFYANISHELKTPLNVIFSTLQLLDMYNKTGKTIDSESTDRYIKIMKQNSYRLSKLANNLIDMSKIEAGYIELHLKNIDIVSFIEGITMSVVEYGEIKGVNLIFDTDVEEKLMAVDPDKIERIMLNLLSNAFKFTNPDDEIKVQLTDGKDKILISVKDTGIGIPEDKLEFIFERFKQVDKSLTRNAEGSGIGLSLAKSLVNMHSGSIYARSKVGKGSEFFVELPAKIIDEEDNLSERSLENNSDRISVEFSDIYFNS